jgi:SAM-dependent methyltransferase
MRNAAFLRHIQPRHPHATLTAYSAIASEYYDALRHPTCKNLRDASTIFLERALSLCGRDSTWICDVGAGDSIVAALMLRRKSDLSRLLLVDCDYAMLSYSSQYSAHGAELLLGTNFQLPFPSKSIGTVISSLGDPYNRNEFWSELCRVLRPGGICLFTTPSFEWAVEFRASKSPEKKDAAYFELKNGTGVYVPSFIYSIDQQDALIRQYGLRVVDVEKISSDKLPRPLSPKLLKQGSPLPHVLTGFVVTTSRS